MTVELGAEPGDLPEASTATVDFLVVGSGAPSFGKVESSISLVRDGPALIMIDPGMVSDRRKILDPLEKPSVDPKAATDIVLSHHHPDHTLNAALFPNAGSTTSGRSTTTTAGPGALSRVLCSPPPVRLIATPDHSPEDITT